MHYLDEGTGETLLFVHGTPTWSFEFRHLLFALSPTFRCIAPDHLGFGLSERPAAFPYTPEAHGAALADFVEQLDLIDVTLVVHDFGGPIGLPLAVRGGTRIARVVLINTWMWPFDDDPAMARRARLAGGPVGRWLYKYTNASLRLLMPSAYGRRALLTPKIHRQYLEVFRDRQSRVQVLHTLAKALLGSRSLYADLLAGAGRLRDLPTLIVWGLKDSAFDPAQLTRWQGLLPYAATCVIAEAGHWPHEESPEQVIDALRAFIESNPLGSEA